eukprot:3357800-Prymnesium_polylepis.1
MKACDQHRRRITSVSQSQHVPPSHQVTLVVSLTSTPTEVLTKYTRSERATPDAQGNRENRQDSITQ